jgi:hypothetical protein
MGLDYPRESASMEGIERCGKLPDHNALDIVLCAAEFFGDRMNGPHSPEDQEAERWKAPYP